MKTHPAITQAVLDDCRAKGIEIDAVHTSMPVVHGIRTRLVSAVEAEQVQMVVCGYPPAAFPDEDILTWCADCHCAIVHRPHAPRTPPKVCPRCARLRVIQFEMAR